MNVETMRLLVAKGLSAEDILEIAETMDAPKGRSAAAERQARYRARKAGKSQADAVTSDVTRDVTDGDAAPLALPPKDNNSNPPTHTPEHTPRARKADDFPMPEFCRDEQTWRDFKANRKAKRLPCTPSAHAKLLRDIERLSDDEWPPGRLFEEIVARGWAAAHDPRETRKPSNDRPSHRPQPPRDNRDPYTQLLDERLGLGDAERPPDQAGRSDAGDRAGHREHVPALARNRR